MKVKELIEMLSELSEDAEIKIALEDYGDNEWRSITKDQDGDLISNIEAIYGDNNCVYITNYGLG